jgi:hypothetical protein
MAEGSLATVYTYPAEGKAVASVSVARDLCKVVQQYAYPVTLDCSLACTPIRWPMINGTLVLQFYKDNPLCPQFGQLPSDYLKFDYPEGVTFGLGCNRNRDEGRWQGQSMIYGFYSQTPQLGITFRMTASFTVANNASLNLVVNIERLVPASETGNPDGLNTFTQCTSFSANLVRDLISNNTDPFNRQSFWVMKHANPISLSVQTEQCPFDAKSVVATVLLTPYRVGCDGTAEGHPSVTECSFNTGNKTYTCLSALVKPTTHGVFKPRWIQLGVNPNLSNINGTFGCFNGVNSGPLLNPPVVADLKPDIPFLTPQDNYLFDLDLLNCGCPGENNQSSDKQQIQVAVTQEEFNLDYKYQVLVKSVNGGAPCLAIRPTSSSVWTVGGYSVDQEILQDSGHWVASASFPNVLGQPIVVLYGMEFPTGIIAGCVNAVSQESNEEPLPQESSITALPSINNSAKEIIEKMKVVRNLPCVHLGEELESEPTCGCGGTNETKKFRLLHSCSIHGKCRISALGNAMTCWKCPDYIDRTENNGMIEGNNGG